MREFSPWTFLLCLSISCVAPGAIEPVPEATRVVGRITWVDDLTEPRVWRLDEEMAAVAGRDEYVDAMWLVAEDGGLANCVVTLHSTAEDAPKALPMESALFEKVGPEYVPRVLIVTTGTPLTVRNRNSPCLGYRTTSAVRWGFNMMLVQGGETIVDVSHRGANRVVCDLREYMRGAIVSVDTPYYALTDEAGAFAINVEPGTYRVRVWHEGIGYAKGLEPREVVVREQETKALDYALRRNR